MLNDRLGTNILIYLFDNLTAVIQLRIIFTQIKYPLAKGLILLIQTSLVGVLFVLKHCMFKQ